MNENNAMPKKFLVLKKEDIRELRVRTDVRTGLNVQSVKNQHANCNTCGCNTTSVPAVQM